MCARSRSPPLCKRLHKSDWSCRITLGPQKCCCKDTTQWGWLKYTSAGEAILQHCHKCLHVKYLPRLVPVLWTWTLSAECPIRCLVYVYVRHVVPSVFLTPHILKYHNTLRLMRQKILLLVLVFIVHLKLLTNEKHFSSFVIFWIVTSEHCVFESFVSCKWFSKKPCWRTGHGPVTKPLYLGTHVDKRPNSGLFFISSYIVRKGDLVHPPTLYFNVLKQFISELFGFSAESSLPSSTISLNSPP